MPNSDFNSAASINRQDIPSFRKGELTALLEFSARIGNNPLLVQGSTGNTSLKIDGTLWIKASGQWLGRSLDDGIFVPVDLARVLRSVQLNREPAAGEIVCGSSPLHPSIETAMHAVLPHRVVVHVHSVNAIAWAVRRDAPARLAERLAGLDWQWVPYTPSGLALAQRIQNLLSRYGGTNIFLLGNHGLVVCADSPQAAETLLQEVEKRLAVIPRCHPKPDLTALSLIAGDSEWSLPPDEILHALATDSLSESIFSAGTLYPCQDIFLCTSGEPISNTDAFPGLEPFLVVSGVGVLISKEVTRAAYAILLGLVQVVQRIDPSAPLRYLTTEELDGVSGFEASRYRQFAEMNGRVISTFVTV